LITGEATPYYIYHPHVPHRIAKRLPNAKIIMMLRSPVDRAYSHFLHNRKLNVEPLSFEEAIEKEAERLEGELENMMNDHNYYSYKHQMYSYLDRGLYIGQVKNWMKRFSKDQVLIIKSEEFFQNPSCIFRKTLDFLNLPRFELREYRKYNASDSTPMCPHTREYLVDYFSPSNQALYEYLNMDLDWDK
jgi:hypothetical protein